MSAVDAGSPEASSECSKAHTFPKRYIGKIDGCAWIICGKRAYRTLCGSLNQQRTGCKPEIRSRIRSAELKSLSIVIWLDNKSERINYRAARRRRVCNSAFIEELADRTYLIFRNYCLENASRLQTSLLPLSIWPDAATFSRVRQSEGKTNPAFPGEPRNQRGKETNMFRPYGIALVALCAAFAAAPYAAGQG
jgi:hypothetical protein